MKTKTIFKTLALATMMPAMLLTTACSSDDDAIINNEPTVKKGYALPVTVNVTRQGDATTRATYTDNGDRTGSLAFSDGDKLFVEGLDNGGAGQFAGTLTWQSGGTFSGTIYTQNPYPDTADDLFTSATSIATLLPNGYQSTGFLSIDNNNSPAIAYDDEASPYFNGAFVASETAKATGVEQLSFELATTYNSGFALTPRCAILNFTISGLEAGAKDVTLQIHRGEVEYTVTGSVTPNASGVATFAIGVPAGANIKDTENNLTVGTHNFTLPSSTTFAAGKIYNIARNAIPGALIGQFSVSANKKVYFSKGNLQATYDGSAWTWAFAANQWDYIGGRSYEGSETQTGNNFINGNGTVSPNGTVDLFGWSTSATYLGIHKSRDEGDYSGSFVDWGSHADVTAGIGEDWCTLSKDEWVYLFNTREVNGGTGSGKSYTLNATVGSSKGVVLYPDNYTGSAYSGSGWSAFESAGCVFLPAAGYRDEADVEVAGDRGYYWSSSAYGDEEAYYVYFRSDDWSSELIVDDFTDRYNGMSVRLVRPVQ